MKRLTRFLNRILGNERPRFRGSHEAQFLNWHRTFRELT